MTNSQQPTANSQRSSKGARFASATMRTGCGKVGRVCPGEPQPQDPVEIVAGWPVAARWDGLALAGGRRGSILVGLLWCLALLSVVVIGLLHTATLHLKIGKNYADKIQARYLALAGVEKAKALLYQDAFDRRHSAKNHTGALYDAPEQFQEVAFGPGEFSVFRRARVDESGGIVFGISDEESRLNINQIQPEDLARLPGLAPEIVGAITDWKDEDDNVSPGGAELEYYGSLRPPYVPRNGPFQTVRELLMVRGVSRDLLFGDDAKQNGLLDVEEPTSGKSAAVAVDPGLWDVLTVQGVQRNVNASGDDRVNIQTADETELTAIHGITREIARAMVAYRGQHKFETIADLLDVTASQQGNRGQGNQGPKVITEDLFTDIADFCTAQNERDLPSLLNINTASAQALACLSGSSPELAQAIVSYRTSTGFFDTSAGLLKVPGMSRDIFKRLANRVTARSETFRIISQGTVSSSGIRQRLEVVVQIGPYEVQTLAYREDL